MRLECEALWQRVALENSCRCEDQWVNQWM